MNAWGWMQSAYLEELVCYTSFSFTAHQKQSLVNFPCAFWSNKVCLFWEELVELVMKTY